MRGIPSPNYQAVGLCKMATLRKHHQAISVLCILPSPPTSSHEQFVDIYVLFSFNLDACIYFVTAIPSSFYHLSGENALGAQ